DPYQVSTPEQLSNVRDFRGSSFIQTSNIDLGVAPWNVGEGWEPIGNDSIEFTGSYDGNNFNINNLTINRPEQDFIGLFGYCNDLKLSNIELVSIDITGKNSVGGLVGYCYGNHNTNCQITGMINGESEVGGIIGTGINYCINMSCYANVNVTATSKVGGFVGSSVGDVYTFIYKSYSIGSLSGDENVGGLIGYSENPSARFCYWNTETSGQATSSGGEGRTTDEMTYAYSSDTYEYWDFNDIWAEDLENVNNGYPFLQSKISGLSPSAPTNLTTNTQNGEFAVELTWNNPDTLINGDLLTDLTTIYVYRNFELIHTDDSPTAGEFNTLLDTVSHTGKFTYKIVGENTQGFGITARIEQPVGNLFAGGTGTELDPYLVSSAEHLNNIRYFTEEDSTYYLQTDNIDLGVSPWNEDKGWIPIGHDESEFRGNFEGGDFLMISNLTIDDSTANYASLFGAIRNANINNVQLENVNIVGYLACGALIGHSFTSYISNCSSTGIVTGLEEIGGLVGATVETSVFSCFSEANIFGKEYIGGLIGYVVDIMGSDSNKVVNCYARGNIVGESRVGGLIGITDLPVISCYSTGSVTGSSDVGGLIGRAAATATNCYWDIESSGQTTSARGEGRTTDDMTPPYSDSTYVDWDFENIWSIGYPTKGYYPILKWQIDSSIEENESSLPNNFTLEQNYPNPFNPSTRISYTVPSGYYDNVKLEIFNTKGELVKTLVNKKQNAGKYSIDFNASNLNSGMYFYTLKTLNSATTKKMILLK
ncbi:MAG: T9SS type A sorting domain-containing protein, partial [Candidatus Delongbacteria bacterium]|nr:T9SS type A sorting domain-containing protein [Candidatus Delongbacteria bacterium]